MSLTARLERTREESAGTSNYRDWSYVYAPTGLAAVYYNNNGTAGILYVNTDHLGSPLLVINSTGSVVAEYSYDAWGRRRDPADWDYTGFTASNILIRGYTGHEMLNEVGLVNILSKSLIALLISENAYCQLT